MTTAFVLSGGASLGAIQVGMLLALSEGGIRPDLIVGSSVGALNGAWISNDPSPSSVRELAEVWQRLRRADVFGFRAVHGVLGLMGRRSALLDASGLRRLVRECVAFPRLEDAPIPLYVVTVDVANGVEVLLSSGDAVDAIAASAAIPGIFPPVQIGEHTYMDGGMVNNTPISHAVALGADTIWVLPAGYSCSLPGPPASALGMALHGLNVTLQHRLASDVAHYEPLVDLRVVPPLCPVTVSPADFRQTADLITRAHTATTRWLESPGPTCIHQHTLLEVHPHHR